MMMNEPRHFSGLRGMLAREHPLARHTTWRCGGAAELFFRPADRDDLAEFVRQWPRAAPLTVIGLGSNLLVRDGGVRGAVILMHDPGATIRQDGARIVADATVAAPKLARFAARHDRADAEFLAGIPGTVGGALAMNAGCYGDETWNHVESVELLQRDGTFTARTPRDYRIGYRSVLHADGGALDEIFTAASFGFPEGDGRKAQARIRELLAQRIATQPLEMPNAGSVFRNPEGDHAARLIEACGLKGFAIGGASVSGKHANFIVNPGRRARSADIEAIIAHVRQTVRSRFAVDLLPEVRIVGDAGTEQRR